MNTSKVALVANATLGKILSIIGYALGALAVIALLTIFISELDSDTVIGIIFTLVVLLPLGIFFIVKGLRIKQRIKRFKQYVSLISSQQMTSIENIAASTSQTVDFVTKDLAAMIKRRFFANATIDMASHEIVIAGKKSSPPAQAKGTAFLEMEAYICAGCEAEGQKPKGGNTSCDYCGNAV
jgi:hypothetical protein